MREQLRCGDCLDLEEKVLALAKKLEEKDAELRALRIDYRDMLGDLIEWEKDMGGWEAGIWQQAKRRHLALVKEAKK